jgi:hypothetical protein
LLTYANGWHDDEDAEGGAESENESRIGDRKRVRHHQHCGHHPQGIQRRAALIARTAGQVDDRHQRRAVNRRAAVHDAGVGNEHGDGREHRAAAQVPGKPECAEEQAGEDGDVPA